MTGEHYNIWVFRRGRSQGNVGTRALQVVVRMYTVLRGPVVENKTRRAKAAVRSAAT